jgi:aspartyl-tRNA(Asn)/glutamyl-tRNA(Gln) amidotransferase subunit C
MSPEDLDVEYVAELARIKLTPEEVATFRSQLGHVLDHVARLNRLNVAGVELTAHGFPLYNVFRADEVRPSLPRDEALANAPRQAQGLFLVTKVLD